MIDTEILQKAIKLTQTGHFKEAKGIYEDLLEKEPDDVNLLSLYGLFNVNIGNFEKAVEILSHATEIKETLGTVSALGLAAFEMGDYQKSAEVLEHSLQFGQSPDILNKLILSLFEIKNYEKAIEYSDKMYTDYPEDSRAIANKVKSLTKSGKLLEAENLCVTALKQNPDVSSLWFHLGFLKELIYCDDKQAKECYKVAAELGNPDADYNIAVSCMKLQEFDEAEKYYKKMLEKRPNDVDTITSLGMCYLAQRQFKEGYDLFFRRNKSSLDKKTNNPWKPDDEIAQEVVIICDQGFGDQIQFARYLSFLGNRKINVAILPNLKGLLAKNYPNCNFISYDEIDPEMQSIRITDLAYVLGMDFEHIPCSEGYLKSERADIKSDKLKVGLCWEAGAAGIRTMINRTIHVKCFEPLFELENIQVYSFQLNDTLGGNEKYPQMINLAKDFKSFSDTAKALMAMDVMVTVDTSVAHLAGALGVKTFLMLPYVTDWRWFCDTKTTDWYKSVEIFKQTDNISWEEQLNNIVELLKKE